MKHMKITDWAATALVSTLAMGSVGCAENDATIFVRQMQALTSDTECVITEDPGGLINLRGQYDPLCSQDDEGNFTSCAGGQFVGFPLVGNGMVSRGNGDILKAESNHVQLDRIERVVVAPGGQLLTPDFDDDVLLGAVAGFIEVGSPSNPGHGVARANLLTPGEAIQAMTAAQQQTGSPNTTVVVEFKLLGETVGGKDVETGVYRYPIDIRNAPGRFANCCDVDLTMELESTDIPCIISQGEGLGAVDPRLDPNQNCSTAMCP